MNNNYDMAKAVLRNARKSGLSMLVYYNGYKLTRTLKVFYFCWGDAASSKQARATDKRLQALAKSSELREGRGGHLYRFAR